MSDLVIQTDHLDLKLKTRDEVVDSINAMSPADRAEVSPVWLAQMLAAPTADHFLHRFAMVDRLSGDIVGGCGFKGPPGADATVEVAYGVAPEHQGQGYAT